MSLLNTVAEIFISQMGKNGSQMDLGVVFDALKGLLPTKGGELDIGSLVSQFLQKDGLASIASSWLGNGANDGISAAQLINVLGDSQIGDFASKLGINTDTAVDSLSQILPELIDKNSTDGNLLGDNALDLAKGILGKLF